MIQIQNDNKLKLFLFPKSNYYSKCQLKSVFFQDSSSHFDVKEGKHPYRPVNGESTTTGYAGSPRNSITVDGTDVAKGQRSSCQVGTSENIYSVKDITIQIKLHLLVCNNFSPSKDFFFAV